MQSPSNITLSSMYFKLTLTDLYLSVSLKISRARERRSPIFRTRKACEDNNSNNPKRDVKDGRTHSSIPVPLMTTLFRAVRCSQSKLVNNNKSYKSVLHVRFSTFRWWVCVTNLSFL